MLLQVCPNGPHKSDDHPRLPLTIGELTESIGSALAAGASEAHVHPKNSAGEDSLHPDDVNPLVEALRTSHPTLPIGVTTGIWAVRDHGQRMAQVSDWRSLPDYASVNWHEDGAEELADLLLDLGIGIEAGLWTTQAAEQFCRYPRAGECLRILIEGTSQDIDNAIHEAGQVLELVRPLGLRILLHGEGANTWPLFDLAVANGLDSRIGLEDTFALPEGSTAANNSELVRTALARVRGSA
jgi:uncharacterized protein (DUF849 family)